MVYGRTPSAPHRSVRPHMIPKDRLRLCMGRLSNQLLTAGGFNGPLLLVVAADKEFEAVVAGRPGLAESDERSYGLRRARQDGLLVVRSGIGKVNAALAVAHCARELPFHAVVSLGIAGALPGSNLAIGDTVVADRSVYADEGLQTPTGFVGCAAMGFPLGPFGDRGIPTEPALLAALSALGRVGPIATVSTCSGTHAAADAVVLRTGAIAEAMEGAAIGHAAQRHGLAFAEVRVISNTTGDREGQVWDLKGALGVLKSVAAVL